MIANEYGIKRSTIFKKMEQGNTLEEALAEILKKEVIFFKEKNFSD
jgi:predicted RNase H-like HicB family nuclease